MGNKKTRRRSESSVRSCVRVQPNTNQRKVKQRHSEKRQKRKDAFYFKLGRLLLPPLHPREGGRRGRRSRYDSPAGRASSYVLFIPLTGRRLPRTTFVVPVLVLFVATIVQFVRVRCDKYLNYGIFILEGIIIADMKFV